MHLMLPLSLPSPSQLLLLLLGSMSLIGSQTIQPASSSAMLMVGCWLGGCEAGDSRGDGEVGRGRGVGVPVLGRVLGIGGKVWRGGGLKVRRLEVGAEEVEG